MSWREKPIMCLDLETTGLFPYTDRPVTVALAYLDPAGRVIDSRVFLCNPGIPISDGAAAIHGLTAEKVAQGTPYERVIDYVVRRLQRAHHRGEPLVIMNARFDWTMLTACARRLSLPLPPIPLLDPVPIDRTLDKYRPGKRTLLELSRTYGLGAYAAHTASADAAQAGRIMQAMGARFAPQLDLELEALQQWQAQMFEEWRVHLNEYWATNGNPHPHAMAPGWPVVEESDEAGYLTTP